MDDHDGTSNRFGVQGYHCKGQGTKSNRDPMGHPIREAAVASGSRRNPPPPTPLARYTSQRKRGVM